MGNCAGSREAKSARKQENSCGSGAETSPGEVILKVLVEVNHLNSKDGALRWQPVLESLVPLSVHHSQVGNTAWVCKLEATGVDGRLFRANIKIPGTKLRKSSFNFIQWKDDEKEEAWGLNFMCESDADSFLKACSPPSLSPKSQKLQYSVTSISLSAPIPTPPNTAASMEEAPETTDSSYVQESNAPPKIECHEAETLFEETPTDKSHAKVNGAPPKIICNETEEEENADSVPVFLSPSASDEFLGETSFYSIRSDGDDDESISSDSLELFQPSSPFKIKEEFLLPDIIEENETEAEADAAENTLEDAAAAVDGGEDIDAVSFHSSLEDGDLEIKETDFNDEKSFDADHVVEESSALPDTSNADLEESLDPPTLPVSPPPGPLLLSPEKDNTALDMFVLAHAHRKPLEPESHVPYNPMSFRHSVAGALEDVPPPLPLSRPPGKLISPRQSSGFLDLAELSFGGVRAGSRRPLDVSQLALKMQGLSGTSEKVENGVEENEDKDSDEYDKATPTNNLESQSVMSDDVLTLVPPPVPEGELSHEEEEEETEHEIRQRLGSHHLKTLEPPKEFSDSGFLDTDMGVGDQVIRNDTKKPVYIIDIRGRGASNGGGGGVGALPNLFVSGIEDSSVPCTSDEQLTENSCGSLGLKTVASSGSENSGSGSIPGENGDEGSKDILSSSCTIKEEEEEEGIEKTPLEMAEQAGQQASSLLMSIIRKTGWLEMKTVLVSKNRKVALKSKRRWKKYWANLKRSTLLLYECDEQSALPELETVHSDMKLDLENSLAHAVHDYVKRDNLFCLSTSSGNTYYMQTTSQAEVEDWIACMHCAAAVACTLKDRDHSVPILMEKLEKLNEKIEKENKLKNLTSLNLTSAEDGAAKTMAAEKLVECSENLEAYRVELYRIRCYIASLQGTELPNPQSLLGSISKPTKNLLGKIGIFSAGSLHAIVSARCSMHSSASTISLHTPKTKIKDKFASLPRSPGGQKRRGSLDISGPYPNLSSLAWGKSSKSKGSSLPAGMKGSVSLRSFEITGPFPKLSPQTRGRFKSDTDQSSPDGTPRSKRSMEISGPYPISLVGLGMKSHTPLSDQDERTGDEMEASMADVFPEWSSPLVNVARVRIPSGKLGGQMVHFTLRNDMTAEQLLAGICEKFRLSLADHFVRLKGKIGMGSKNFIPKKSDVVMEQNYSEIEICQKSLKTFSLTAEEESTSFGLVLVPEWDANTEIDLQSVLVEEVKEGSVAESRGIGSGDEVVLVEGKSVMELGWVEVERLMAGREVNITMRTCVVDAPLSHHRIMDSLICPAPPTSHPQLSGEMLQSLVVPTPSVDSSLTQETGSDTTMVSKDQIEHLLNDTNEISRLLRRWQAEQTEEAAKAPWTKEDKLRKSISDLIESEADYVRLLNVLVERYFEPLRHESYLSQHEVENLIGNIVSIVEVQNSFLSKLKGAWKVDVETGDALKEVVLSVARLFQSHMDHFKCYSAFCASHQIVKQLLTVGENEALTHFFKMRNPTLDPSLNVDSLLTKPIVRISRYPLFLSAMLDHVTKESGESLHLKGVMKEMGEVGNHMNEMQRLCETYWSLIHSLANDPKLYEIGVSVQISELKYHKEATWLNPSIDGLSKNLKKGQGPRMKLFIFKSSVLLVCLERKHKRKESKGMLEIRLEAEDVKYREILPTVRCAVSNLPDSDGVTNMWRLQHRSKSSQTMTYFFRSNSLEDKMLATDLIQHSIMTQQRLYGASPSIARATSLPPANQLDPSSHSSSSSSSQPHHQLHHRVTSPTPSNLSISSTVDYGTGTASDTDHS